MNRQYMNIIKLSISVLGLIAIILISVSLSKIVNSKKYNSYYNAEFDGYYYPSAESESNETEFPYESTEGNVEDTEKAEETESESQTVVYDRKKIIFTVRNSDSNLVTNALSVFGNKTGVFVLEHGKLPGQEGMLSSVDYVQMLSNGWQSALGDTFPNTVDEFGAWEERLVTHISVLTDMRLKIPHIYCFYGNAAAEMIPSATEFLAQYGFDNVIFESGSSDTSIVPSISAVQICENTTNDILSALDVLPLGKSMAVNITTLSSQILDPAVETSTAAVDSILHQIIDTYPDTVITAP